MSKKSFSKPRNLISPFIATLLYTVIFFPLHSLMGDGVSALSLFPVAIAGWFLGIYGGLLWSVFILILDITLFVHEGELSHTRILLSGGVVGFLSTMVIGIASGWARELNEKIKKELLDRIDSDLAFQKSEHKYRSLFENMVEGIVIDQIVYENGKPIDWIIQDTNPAYEKILAISREKVIGQIASTIYGTQQSIEPYLSVYDKVLKTGIPIHGKTHSFIGNREIAYSITSLGDNLVSVFLHDITEQERALQGEREQRELAEAMRNIASALNKTIQLNEVLDIIFLHMEQFVPYDAADIMLIKDKQLRIERYKGYSERGLDQFAKNFNVSLDEIPTARWMVQNLSPLIVADTTQSDVWTTIPETSWIGSYLGLPIIAKGKMIGILNFLSSRKGFFQDYSFEHLLPFAEQAALAIENARAFEETQKRARRLALINRVASRLNMPDELNEIQYLAVDSIAEALGLDQVGLALLNQNKHYLTLVAYHPAPGNPTATGSTIPLENNPSMDYILEHKTSFLSEDAQHDPRLAPVRNIMVSQAIHSILIVPLIIRGEVIGTVGCDITVEGRKLSQEEINLAETLTNLVAGRIEQARLLEVEKKRGAELRMLYETTLAITQSYDPPKLLKHIVERAAWLLDSSAGILYLISAEGNFLECKVSYNNEYDHEGTTLHMGEGAAGIVTQTAQPLIIPNYANWKEKPTAFQGIEKPFALLTVPVIWQSKVKGVIQIIREPGKPPFEQGDANLLALFSSQVAITLENTRLYQEVQQLAVQDPLTGLYNRRGLTEIGIREIERAQRFQHPLSILFLDVDHFKVVNDTYGHAAGDQVLAGVANLCRKDLRNVDVISRYGGEEFVVLLLESNLKVARFVAKRLCSTIANSPIPTDNGNISITMSIGIAEIQANTVGLDDLIHQADQAMYKAKSSGRNCAYVYNNKP
jgi:diguanylate cyclase (GGDEF)-like protein